LTELTKELRNSLEFPEPESRPFGPTHIREHEASYWNGRAVTCVKSIHLNSWPL